MSDDREVSDGFYRYRARVVEHRGKWRAHLDRYFMNWIPSVDRGRSRKTKDEALADAAERAKPFASECEDPDERVATPEEVDDGCELGIAYADCGKCAPCRLRDALEAV